MAQVMRNETRILSQSFRLEQEAALAVDRFLDQLDDDFTLFRNRDVFTPEDWAAVGYTNGEEGEPLEF